MTPEERDQMHLKFDIADVIAKTFFDCAKVEPKQLVVEDFDDPFSICRFERFSKIAVDNILKEYDVIKICK